MLYSYIFALNVWCKVDNVGENLRKNSCNNHFLLIWTSFYLFCIPFIFFLYLLLLCCDLYKNYVTIFEMHVIQTRMRSNVVSVQYPYTCQQQWAYLLNSTACVNEKTMYGVIQISKMLCNKLIVCRFIYIYFQDISLSITISRINSIL